MNTLMFVFVSIPMAVKNQAKRKPGFSDYKKQTRMLFPLKKFKIRIFKGCIIFYNI